MIIKRQIGRKQLLQTCQNGRDKLIEKQQKMKALNEKLKLEAGNMNNIQYENIGEYEIPTNPSPAFSYMCKVVNFSEWNDYSRDFTPTRIRALEIKRKYQPLTQAEERELAFSYRTRNKFKLAQDAEDNRNARLAVSEAGKYLRAWV